MCVCLYIYNFYDAIRTYIITKLVCGPSGKQFKSLNYVVGGPIPGSCMEIHHLGEVALKCVTVTRGGYQTKKKHWFSSQFKKKYIDFWL